MTRKAWAGVMILALLVIGASGFYIVSALNEKRTVQVPLKEIHKEELAPVVETSSATTISPSTATTASVEATPAPIVIQSKPEKKKESLTEHKESKKESPKKESKPSNEKSTDEVRKILFRYKNFKAKKVTVVGSFNKWNGESMSKDEKGIWTATIKIKPGHYEYKFEVDGKRLRDPNNRLFDPKGNSMLNVKPLSEK